MEPIKIEWVYTEHLCDNGQLSSSVMEQVVRLAEVEKLIDTAVMHAQWLVQITDGESDENQDARSFLASVAAWRKGQEGKEEK